MGGWCVACVSQEQDLMLPTRGEERTAIPEKLRDKRQLRRKGAMSPT
jgi:hypothetical protein